MKIALIAPTRIPSRRANTIQTMKMAQALSLIGNDVNVIVPRAAVLKDPEFNWSDLAERYGLMSKFKIISLPAKVRLRKYDFSLSSLLLSRRLNADLIYTRLPQSAALSSLMGMPTILELHDMPQGSMGPVIFRAFLKGRGAKRLVSITKSLLNDLKLLYSIPRWSNFCVVAPDGVDLTRYKDLPSPRDARHQLLLKENVPNIVEDRFTIGYTGHLYPGRGINLLLEIAANFPQYNFLIVGGEPQDVTRVRKKTMDLGLRNISVTGFIDNSKLPNYQAACELLVMPYQKKISASSGGDIASYLSPMKVFEYLASGRVILSSNLPVLREVLNEDNAILIDPEDTAAWIAKVSSIHKDVEKRMRISTNALEDAKKYSWEIRAASILDEQQL